MVQIHWDPAAMSPNQQKIADYIQKFPQEVLFQTEQELADTLGLSIASVSRFWRSVGYKNMKDFKAQVREQLEVTPAGKMKNMMRKVQGGEQQEAEGSPQEDFLKATLSHLQETMNHFQPEPFAEAVQQLTRAERIYLYGPGPSAGLAELMRFRLSRFGLSVYPLDRGGSELLEDLLHLTGRDLIVLFGFVRALPEARVLLEHAKDIGCKTLLITDRLVSDFTGLPDYELFASRGEMWEFHSMVAPLFLVENLIIAVGMQNQERCLQKLEQLGELRKRYADELPR